MPQPNLILRATSLVNKVLDKTSDLDLRQLSPWHATVTVALSQSLERLDACRMALAKGYWESGVILARAQFEVAVNLCYIAKDPSERLPVYLEHGGIPTTKTAVALFKQRVAEGAVVDAVPRRPWRPLKDMCDDLGPPWPAEYDVFYSLASVSAHAGAATLGSVYLKLRKGIDASEEEKAMLLVTGVIMHLRVARVAAAVFPDQMPASVMQDLESEKAELATMLRG